MPRKSYHPERFAKYVEFFVVKMMILVFTQHIGVMNAKLREEMESLVMSVSRSRKEDSNKMKKIIEGNYN